MMVFPDKDPEETITVTFDFSAVAATIASATVAALAAQGLDDPAAAAMLSGQASIAGPLVIQRVTGGLSGTTYILRCVANDADGEVHVLSAALPVVVEAVACRSGSAMP